MNSNQFAALQQSIEGWLNAYCEKTDWPDVIVGDRTVEHMAKAARSVFEACEESQQFALSEGYVVGAHAAK